MGMVNNTRLVAYMLCQRRSSEWVAEWVSEWTNKRASERKTGDGQVNKLKSHVLIQAFSRWLKFVLQRGWFLCTRWLFSGLVVKAHRRPCRRGKWLCKSSCRKIGWVWNRCVTQTVVLNKLSSINVRVVMMMMVMWSITVVARVWFDKEF